LEYAGELKEVIKEKIVLRTNKNSIAIPIAAIQKAIQIIS